MAYRRVQVCVYTWASICERGVSNGEPVACTAPYIFPRKESVWRKRARECDWESKTYSIHLDRWEVNYILSHRYTPYRSKLFWDIIDWLIIGLKVLRIIIIINNKYILRTINPLIIIIINIKSVRSFYPQKKFLVSVMVNKISMVMLVSLLKLIVT